MVFKTDRVWYLIYLRRLPTKGIWYYVSWSVDNIDVVVLILGEI